MKLLGENSPSPSSFRQKLRRLLWLGVQSTLFRWSPAFMHGWRRFLLRAFGARLVFETNFKPRVWPDVDIYYPWLLELHAGSLIGPGCRIYNLAAVTLEPGANLSRHVHVCAGSHDFLKWEMPLTVAPVVVGENSWIATDCFIGPGVRIGPRAVVGARSVVIKSQPADFICWGHPCQPQSPRPPLA